MKAKIGIIGGGGFVGASLARHLINNFEVNILDVRSPPKDLEDAAGYVYCDIRNYKDVVNGLKDLDLVIDTAIIQIPLINEQKRLGYEVNVIGTQNVCKAVEENPKIKGMILSSSWHTIGERDLKGVIDEEFGFRPDKVERRAILYALSKMAQEAIMRFYDEMFGKIYGIIRMGTVLGEGMPKETAASIFMERGLKGESITPFRHSMYRPMLYVGIEDICGAYKKFAMKILNEDFDDSKKSLSHIFNIYYPKPINILQLAEIVKSAIYKCSREKIVPKIEIIDRDMPILFEEKDIGRLTISISKAQNYLGIKELKSPTELINQMVASKLNKMHIS